VRRIRGQLCRRAACHLQLEHLEVPVRRRLDERELAAFGRDAKPGRIVLRGEAIDDTRVAAVPRDGEDDMAAQAEQIYKNIAAILSTEGAGLSDIVRATTYIVDMTERAAVSAIRKKLFPTNPPATSLVEVSALAGDEWLIEVEVTAVIPRKTT